MKTGAGGGEAHGYCNHISETRTLIHINDLLINVLNIDILYKIANAANREHKYINGRDVCIYQCNPPILLMYLATLGNTTRLRPWRLPAWQLRSKSTQECRKNVWRPVHNRETDTSRKPSGNLRHNEHPWSHSIQRHCNNDAKRCTRHNSRAANMDQLHTGHRSDLNSTQRTQSSYCKLHEVHMYMIRQSEMLPAGTANTGG